MYELDELEISRGQAQFILAFYLSGALILGLLALAELLGI